VTDLIGEYIGKLRPPGRTIYVLDTSAPMRGARLSHLEQALLALTGAGHTLAGRFSQFQSGEEVTFLPFSYAPATPRVFSIPASDPGPALAGIRDYISGLRAHGRTAIYDTLVRAYQIIAGERAPQHRAVRVADQRLELPPVPRLPGLFPGPEQPQQGGGAAGGCRPRPAPSPRPPLRSRSPGTRIPAGSPRGPRSRSRGPHLARP
jgi:hypothetical protein